MDDEFNWEEPPASDVVEHDGGHLYEDIWASSATSSAVDRAVKEPEYYLEFEDLEFDDFQSDDFAVEQRNAPDSYANAYYVKPNDAQLDYVKPTYAVQDYAQQENVKPTYAMQDSAQQENVKPTYAVQDYAQQDYVKPTYAVQDYAQQENVKPTYAVQDYARPENVKPTYAVQDYVQPEYVKPTYAAQDYVQPEYVKPTYAAQADAEPEYVKPTYAQQDRAEPEYIKPTYAAQADAEPEYVKPTYAQQDRAEPEYIKPFAKPEYAEPSYAQPEVSKPDAKPNYYQLQSETAPQIYENAAADRSVSVSSIREIPEIDESTVVPIRHERRTPPVEQLLPQPIPQSQPMAQFQQKESVEPLHRNSTATIAEDRQAKEVAPQSAQPEHHLPTSLPIHRETVAVPRHHESIALPKYPEFVALQKHPEAIALQKHNQHDALLKRFEQIALQKQPQSIPVQKALEPVSVQKHPEPIAVQKHLALIAVHKHPEPTAVQKHPEPIALQKHRVPVAMQIRPEPIATPARSEAVAAQIRPEIVSSQHRESVHQHSTEIPQEVRRAISAGLLLRSLREISALPNRPTQYTGSISTKTTDVVRPQFSPVQSVRTTPKLPTADRPQPRTEQRELIGAEVALGLLFAASAISKHNRSNSAPPDHRIQKGESVTKIADHFYGDPQLGWLIIELNATSMRQEVFGQVTVVEVFADTRLRLPSWEDLARFYKQPFGNGADNLITVVTESSASVGREALQTLALAMGCA